MKRSIQILEKFDDIIQITVAIVLFAVATVVLVVASIHFITHFKENISYALVMFIHELLMIMILLELVYTIMTFLREHSIPLEPFIIIGIISSLRKLLTIGAQMSISESEAVMAENVFQHYITELIVNTGIVFILIVALYIIRKFKTFQVPKQNEEAVS